ncbi:TIGR02452 family protein [Clostridium beijerinckii]|uniref:TIGR02452 family protein n=1 Tax=Clostridium beijerinckii TaxID=1520 RepID=UPI0011AFA761|nr:TIGR02452 family protein [Clostridium beijerinckii]MBN7579683.1 TIGR02452 family protein [Clostridium beijerinckii]MBN7585387.1 TIGR02452 family protein [Clostridium beijerinckii]MBO0520771.1 TIGR02452 family protein [Clostridium beijerinckii]
MKYVVFIAITKSNGGELSAYGCGVFRNDPKLIAQYWRELLINENFISYFDNIIFAVLDNSKNQNCIKAFEGLEK